MYRESTREDDDPHLSSSSRVSEVVTGTNRSSYQARERTSRTFVERNLTSERENIENDEERLAMKRGDMPPPVPKRVDNPRIREDQALLPLNTLTHKHGLKKVDLYFHNL